MPEVLPAADAPPATAAISYPLPRERNLIIAVLLALSALAWAVVVWQSRTMSGDEMAGITMGMAAPIFLAIWVAMMAAMMFPTAMPMILMFARIQSGKAAREQVTVPVALFVAAYLLVWTLFGGVAFAAASTAQELADHSMWVMDNAPRIGGGVLIAAGIYQLSPLKWICVSKCRSPMSWALNSWRDGVSGALRMGVEHGVYCLGCCWLLFVILFPLGMMNITAMALITVLIFSEKSLPISRLATGFAAAVLVIYGVVVVVMPDALPTMM